MQTTEKIELSRHDFVDAINQFWLAFTTQSSFIVAFLVLIIFYKLHRKLNDKRRPLKHLKFKVSNDQTIPNGVNGPGFDKVVQKINELI